MSCTNSPLVDYTLISPHRGSRNGQSIDTVTVHCTAAQCSVERLGGLFQSRWSANYGIGSDGRIGMYVEEKERSICTSNTANDSRAITIEVASDSSHPYAVNDAAYKSLIALLADICRRNGIEKLIWGTNKNDRVNHKNGCNMTVHRDYEAKACPGEWLYSRHGQIAAEVNKILEEDNEVRYKTIDDIPEGVYRDEAQRLIDEGVLKGKADGTIDISEDMLRCMIFCRRMIDNVTEAVKAALEEV